MTWLLKRCLLGAYYERYEYMEMKEWKKLCTVTYEDRSFDGIAHIVQVQYDERFCPWFAAIQFSDQNAMSLPIEFEVKFESGGKASCHVNSRRSDGFVDYLNGEMETPAVQFYVVGRSSLSTLSMNTEESKNFFE